MVSRHSGLCEIFGLLAARTWTDLRDAHEAGLSLGEEGITDQLLLSLKRACPTMIAISAFNRRIEGQTTGADWEWWFCGSTRSFGMRVQAKKLNIRSLRYDCLDHVVKGTRRTQVNLLIKDAEAQRPRLYPLYCFYNYWPESSVSLRWNCRSFAPHWEWFGCSVCDARAVKDMIAKGEKHVSAIGQISYPWMCLVCCTGYSSPRASLPERARGVAVALSRSRKEPSIRPSRAREVPELVANSRVPHYVQLLLGHDVSERSVEESILAERKIDGLLVVKEAD
jgi:hypothetical protein